VQSGCIGYPDAKLIDLLGYFVSARDYEKTGLSDPRWPSMT